MAKLIELLKEKGVSFPEGFEIGDVLNNSDEVQGLVKAKNELNEWKLTNKPLLDSLKLESEANAKAAHEALEEKKSLALKNNDLQAYLDAEKEAKEKAEGMLKVTRDGVRNAKHETAINEISNLFGGGVLGKSLAMQLVDTSVNESGDVSQVFKINETEFSDFAAFKTAAESDKEYGKFINLKPSQSPEFSANASSGKNSESNKLSERTNNYLSMNRG